MRFFFAGSFCSAISTLLCQTVLCNILLFHNHVQHNDKNYNYNAWYYNFATFFDIQSKLFLTGLIHLINIVSNRILLGPKKSTICDVS